MNDTLQNNRKRLFLDMDGMLAEYRTYYNDDQYLQEGYYISLKPNINVVDAIKKLIQTEPSIDVYVLSAYFDVPNAIAVKEKDAWLDMYLPEINKDHRIYTICGQPKQNFIKGGITESDYLLDDFTHNLEMWEQSNGIGIKLLNGLNSRLGKWDGPRISYKKSPEEILKSIVDIINDKKLVQDTIDEFQLRNEKQGLTMFIAKDKLTAIVEKHFPEYENVDDFRKNFTIEDWRFIRRLNPSVEIRENTSIKQFEFESKTFSEKLNDKLDMLKRSCIERQIDNLKINMELNTVLQEEVCPAPNNRSTKTDLTEITKKYEEANSQWQEYKNTAITQMQRDINDFFEKYNNMSVHNKKSFTEQLNQIKSEMIRKVKNLQTVIDKTDKEEKHRHQQIINSISAQRKQARVREIEDEIFV